MQHVPFSLNMGAQMALYQDKTAELSSYRQILVEIQQHHSLEL
jgi:hypothetical protein